MNECIFHLESVIICVCELVSDLFKCVLMMLSISKII